MPKNVYIVDHPLVAHHVTTIRDKTTPPHVFRAAIHRLSTLIAYEATRGLSLSEVSVETPMTTTKGHRVNQSIGIVPILRAGLGMVDPVLNLIPEAELWHLGFYRDEMTIEPVEYYSKLETGRAVDVALVLDPMLATGGSAIAAIDAVKKWGAKEIRFVAMIAAPEGIDNLHRAHPDVPIHVCVVDEKLDENSYIIPGLGDAGDRIFNTLSHH